MATLKIKKLDNFYALPEYKTSGAAALDLYAAEDAIIRVGEVSLVATGIAIQLPNDTHNSRFEAQIRARSGLASKGIIVVNAPGTIDADFSGEIKVLLSSIVHHQFEDKRGLPQAGFRIKRGDRLAQMAINKVAHVNLEVVEELNETERGSGGLGSTGIR